MAGGTPVSTTPQSLVRAPTGKTLHFRLSVTNVAATLVSLLPGGVLPTIVPPTALPSGTVFVFKGVQLQSETDPATTIVRYTMDGQAVPTTTLGFVLPGGANSTFVTIPADVQDISLIAAAAGPIFVQCYLIIGGTSQGTN